MIPMQIIKDGGVLEWFDGTVLVITPDDFTLKPNPTNYAPLIPLVGDSTASYDQAGWVGLNNDKNILIAESGNESAIYSEAPSGSCLGRALRHVKRVFNYVLGDNGEILMDDNGEVIRHDGT